MDFSVRHSERIKQREWASTARRRCAPISGKRKKAITIRTVPPRAGPFRCTPPRPNRSQTEVCWSRSTSPKRTTKPRRERGHDLPRMPRQRISSLAMEEAMQTALKPVPVPGAGQAPKSPRFWHPTGPPDIGARRLLLRGTDLGARRLLQGKDIRARPLLLRGTDLGARRLLQGKDIAGRRRRRLRFTFRLQAVGAYPLQRLCSGS